MLTSLQLTRNGFFDEATFGELVVYQTESPDKGWVPVFECLTVERPWANNARRVSCIPDGTYEVVPRWYYRGNHNALELLKVPDRSHILIHGGNVGSDVQGCIAVGDIRVWVKDQWAVGNSRRTLTALLGRLGTLAGPEEVLLEIVSQRGPFTVDD